MRCDSNCVLVLRSGVRFHAMPPSKRFRSMDQLSGGEKTMAALALLFSLQAFSPAPFVVLDEVDAALDPKNVNALARYLREATFQVIVISLKDRLYSQVETLVGVLKNRTLKSSQPVQLDLTPYSDVVTSRLSRLSLSSEPPAQPEMVEQPTDVEPGLSIVPLNQAEGEPADHEDIEGPSDEEEREPKPDGDDDLEEQSEDEPVESDDEERPSKTLKSRNTRGIELRKRKRPDTSCAR
eukprot:GHVT01039323.1.p1 GENE.GHVT01039323.1~~GHVT01039323.1.p1  ORF type:complete len:238 (-),score=34.89 GHVT01039323.1:534-1247(-)